MAMVQNFGPLIGEWHQLKSQVEHIDRLDWNAYREQDPIGANDARLSAIEAKNRFQQLTQQVQQIPQALQMLRARQQQELITRNLPKAKELVPDFDKRGDEFVAVGKDLGFTEEEVRGVVDPRYLLALHRLAEAKKLTAKQTEVRQKVAAAPPVVKPGAKSAAPQVSSKDVQKAMHRLRSDSSEESMVAALRAARARGGG